MIRSESFGYDTFFEDDVEYWLDTKEPTELNPRDCPECGQYPTEAGHDPCIANLPGVMYACCGHGKKKPYIAMETADETYTVDFHSVSSLRHFINIGARDPKKMLEKYPDLPEYMIEELEFLWEMKQIHNQILEVERE